MLHRRDFLLSSAAVGAVLASPARADLPPLEPGATPLDRLFQQFAAERMENDPGEATSLGVDTGALAPLKHRLQDTTAAGVGRTRALAASQYERLRAFDARGLTGLERVNHDAVIFGLQVAAEANAAFAFGAPGARSPYVLSQLTGSYQDVPTFLDTQHRVETADDAEAYLDRLSAFARNLDGETARARADAAAGVIPPDFILDQALVQMTALAAPPAERAQLVASLAKRAAAKGIAGDWQGRAAGLYTGQVQPALARQIAAVKALRAQAGPQAGVGRLKDGDHYYAVALKAYTTSSLSPADVHRIGLEQTKAYQAEIDAILKGQGMTRGTVGERLAALSADPKYIWPDTEAGKADMIHHLNGLVAGISPRLPRFFSNPPTVPLEIRRVPPTIEAGAPLGYYMSASLDGSRPAIYYINLHHTADWPRWLVSSVTFHEGVPGHHLQISTAQHIPNLPLIRKTGIYSGYAEGWALYAEQLADELGMYENDPLGRVGYLKSELWRACRMVLDTGIHTMGWSRGQAIRWKMENDGSLESGTANEVDRYCVWPGQAPSYKIGHTVINALRDEARAKQGTRFDIRRFHDMVLNSGAVPLDVLQGMGHAFANEPA